MEDSFSDLDDSFWDAIPTPDPSPTKRLNLQPRTAPMNSTRRFRRELTVARHVLNIIPFQVDAPGHPSLTHSRCTVESVSRNLVNGQKSLSVRLGGEDRRTVTLTDEWAGTDVRVDDVINVVGDWPTSAPSISITSGENLLILHPDLLLTPSALSSSLECRRKPLLSNLVRSSSEPTPALVWGTILHEVMQSCLSAGRWEERWIDEKMEQVIRERIPDIAKVHLSIKMRAKGLRPFSEKYMADVPKSNALLTDTRSGPGETSRLAISQLLDIEEDIWSPTWGLKGKIDATVLAVVSNSKAPKAEKVCTKGPKPFEIKTGRPVAGLEHRAQTMLYTLLLEERYGTEVPSGLLFYTQSEEVVRVPAARNDVKALLGIRNELAAYMMRRTSKTGYRKAADATAVQGVAEPFLPPAINDERICTRCFSLDTCMLYRKAVENVVDTNSPIAQIYDLKTAHLSEAQAAFFKQWEALLSLEEEDALRFRKELWTMGAAEREAKGRCFSAMLLDQSYSPAPTGNTSKIHRFSYRFVRPSASSPLSGQISVGDAITVSVEPNLLALARGFVLDLSESSVVVGVDHDLSIEAIKIRGTRFRPETLPPIPLPVFRVDKDELYGGMGRMRDNLARLFYAGGSARRRELVVDLQPPGFAETWTTLPPRLAQHVELLNADQLDAMKLVLAAQDYAMILGMPGTGKTTVIAAIIKVLVAMGNTVLLTSYTHSAVDTILLKLKDRVDFGILRLGNIDKVHPEIHPFTLDTGLTPTTVEQFEDQTLSPPVVATTCLSVRNIEARKGGLDVSLFRRLTDAHPTAVVNLTHQYRMNEDIMTLSNRLIYKDRLRCGSDAVATQRLALPDPGFLCDIHIGRSCHPGGCWIRHVVSESCSTVFVDTDALPAPESRIGDLVQNEVEANLVYQVTETFIRSGVLPERIGLISVYRQQLKLLEHLLAGRIGLEFLTADKSQGRDKDCIIMSMVRSNDTGYVGELIKDWRRMNVSFTRARSKFIIFGSRKTLQSAPLLREFFDLVESRGWLLAGEKERNDMSVTNENSGVGRPRKKAKVKGQDLLRGRPILTDLANETS
ncbi:AAA domain-containing protein [Mycena vitilis]|nr:AAA domain-containing protein [Mycena vitilis]